MATITVVPDPSAPGGKGYRAVSGDAQGTGATVGQALDGLAAAAGPPAETTLVVVQPQAADAYFTAAQRDRLADLMARWRAARDAGASLPAGEQAELDDLVRAEVKAAADRAAAVLRQLKP